jgi:molybdopterin molybdotransferase
MAQLSDDCFAQGGAPLRLAEVAGAMAARVRVVAEVETVPIAAADGRVLAHALAAPISLPPFDNSAVDGFAVRHADLTPGAETALPVVARVAAGQAAPHLPPRSAIRIFTGAPMPDGADTVFMQEDTHLDGATVVLPPGLGRFANARMTGEDLAVGGAALHAGQVLRPQDIALAAALGLDALVVQRRLRVAVFSTGDELAAPGTRLSGPKIFDSNRPMLAAMLARAGAAVTDLGILPDSQARLAAALSDAADAHDLLLTSGGVSTGEEDHVKDAVARAGRLDHWRVAVKPGRPVALGTIRGAAFAGLPGNPVAVFVTFAFIVRPLLAALSGAAWLPPRAMPVTLGFAHRKKRDRREFVRVGLQPDAGGWRAHKWPQDGAGVITSLTGTDGLLDLEEDRTAIAEGEAVGFIPYGLLG